MLDFDTIAQSWVLLSLIGWDYSNQVKWDIVIWTNLDLKIRIVDRRRFIKLIKRVSAGDRPKLGHQKNNIATWN